MSSSERTNLLSYAISIPCNIIQFQTKFIKNQVHEENAHNIK